MFRTKMIEMTVWTVASESRVMNLLLDFIQIKERKIETEDNGLIKFTFKVKKRLLKKIAFCINRSIQVYKMDWEA